MKLILNILNFHRNTILSHWRAYLLIPGKAKISIVSLIVFGICVASFVYFLNFNESRMGYLLNDPILNFFDPLNFSVAIFLITYSMIILAIAVSMTAPVIFVKLVQAYTIMLLLRMFSMYLFPLEAPRNIIPLEDFFLDSIYSGNVFLKDLFFSGHTATLFLFCFGMRDLKLKVLFTIAAFLVGSMLVLQHVHYSIDVIAAPIAAYLALWIQRKLKLE